MRAPAIGRLLSVAALIAACATAPGTSPAPSATAPAATTLAAATPTADPTAAATPAAAPLSPAPTESLPPRGLIRGYDDSVDGWLGSYCWEGTCADAPGIPPMDELPFVYGGGDLEFSLSDGATFVAWRATYTSLDDTEPVTLGQGGERLDPDASPGKAPVSLAVATFPSPPGGDSILMVQVFLGDGDLSYWWHVDVQRSPPEGEIRLRHGKFVEGQRGSWCYDDGCADLPAFPKVGLPELRANARQLLTFRLAVGHTFGYASATYSTDSGSTAVHELSAVGVYDPDSLPTGAPPISSFEFEGPPVGDWALNVFVRFPNNGGDASYYWHLIVD